MRKYEPIWIELKKNKVAAIKATPQLHSRIRKAVIKEKDKDVGFKLTEADKGLSHRLGFTVIGPVLTFVLSPRLNILDRL